MIDGLPDGLRLPAEWEPHEGTWFTWPHNKDTWHGGLSGPRRALAKAIEALAATETVFVNAATGHGLCPPHAWSEHVDPARIVWQDIPSNDAWCRDHGALVVRRADGRRLALDFGFNAWGGKYPPWDLDAKIARRMAAQSGLDCISVPFVLEGGAIDGNGQGVLMSTASCVLDPLRNQGVDRAQVEALFARAFGTRHVLWLGGDLPGDDTDGHIDNLARFVSPWAVLVVAPRPGTGADALAANPAALEDQARRAGLDLAIETLPMPRTFIEREQLPASYANFYIGNDVVLQPVYGDPQDDRACALVDASFPGRTLVPVDCRELIVGLGAVHCLSQQWPAL